jgi:predicted ATP-grasp superfamily ATP-dependent carboligase
MDVLLLGASVRAAAFSALRAGLRPWAIDLFADRDLVAACPAQAIPMGRYPNGLVDLASKAPPGPWMYTGALENRPGVVNQISRERPLWGNHADCLRRVRDPFALADALHAAGLACPAVSRAGESLAGKWLVKPLASAGGIGVHLSSGRLRNPARRHYGQEFIAGESRSGVFVAEAGGSRLLGVTRQLVGERWLHARPFRYSGSVGPLVLTTTERSAWERLGTAITAFGGLRGLFGVDAIIRDGVPWPVEVNPRYTASVEVIEYATGVRTLALHRRAFESTAAPISDGPAAGVVGKAVWFAPRSLTVPVGGPWEQVLREAPAVDVPPAFADIPSAGHRAAAGQPVLTAFAIGDSIDDCIGQMRVIANDLDHWLLR